MDERIDSSKRIFKMSLPIFMELLLQLLVGNVDQFMISQYSQNSVAAIGIGNQIMNMVIIVINLMSVATTILISRYLGADNQEKIAEVCNVSLAIIGFVSILTSLLLVFGNSLFFGWMQVPENIMGETCSYTTIVGSFVLIQGIHLTFNAILRSYSLLKEVMFASAIMNAVNIIGNAILINGLLGFPQLGIVGAAISTNFSKCVGLGIVIFIFIRKVGAEISLSKYLRPFPKATAKRLLFIGLPTGAESFTYQLSQICVLSFVNLFGTVVIATKVYCNMLAHISYIYAKAISQATQIVIGYLIGAKRYERIEKRVWSTMFISMAVTFSITFLIYLNSDTIFRIFTEDPEVLRLGKQIFFIELFLETGRSINNAMTKCLVAVGDVKVPVIVGIIGTWSCAVGLGWLLGVHLGYGLVGIWIALAADECFRGIIFVFRFLSGKWKSKMMAQQVEGKKQEKEIPA